MEYGAKNWKTKPRYLLLVGDADHDVDWVSQKATLPTILVPTYYNGFTASDQAFVEGIGGDIAVGRLPVRQEPELVRIIAKMLKYETEPPAGDWRRRLSFVASEGRFGPVIDPLIEKAVVTMLEQSVPAGYDVNMTYANPSSKYVYPPERFNDQVIKRFNDGALMYTYVGHGHRRGFDTLRLGGRFYSILSDKDVERIDAGAKNPIMSIIACSTAYFDDPKDDCIAEELLRRQGGPVAVFGATRISHPFSNTLLGRELIDAFFAGQGTIGEVTTLAKRRLVKEWRNDMLANMGSVFVRGLDLDRLMQDHMHLYALLGDPALVCARPVATIEVTAPAEAAPGGEITISGAATGGGDEAVTLTLECERHVILRPTERVNLKEKGHEAKVVANYEAANDKVACRTEARMQGGKFESRLTLPQTLPAGTYYVKAMSASGTALGAAKIMVR
jgi:hypothetical protein